MRGRARARCEPLPALIARADGLEIPAPPAALEERILDRVAASRPRAPAGCRRRPRRLGALAATALAGVADRRRGRRRSRSTVIGAATTAAPAPAYDLVLDGVRRRHAPARPSSPSDGGTEVHLWVDGLPPGGKAVYEVRCERPGWSAGAGTFRADAQGKAYVVLTTAARIGEYERIRIVRGDENVLTGSLD